MANKMPSITITAVVPEEVRDRMEAELRLLAAKYGALAASLRKAAAGDGRSVWVDCNVEVRTEAKT